MSILIKKEKNAEYERVEKEKERIEKGEEENIT